MKDRKIIFECEVGSHLYGTNRPDSDMDLMGIYLPSTQDMFSLQNCPTEWSMNEKVSEGPRNTAGDTDRKFYSLQKFLSLAAEGQSKQLEMLFSNRKSWHTPSRPKRDEWAYIYQNRDLFVSKQAIIPFVGFAKAQAYKATLKGDNLNTLRKLIEILESLPKLKQKTIWDLLTFNEEGEVRLFGLTIETYKETRGRGIELLGRRFEFNSSGYLFLKQLRDLEKKYGTRSEAAAEVGYDYKSLCHAYRLLFEAEELLTTGKLTFPLHPMQVDLLMAIRSGDYKADYFNELESMITRVKNIKSDLPDKPNRSKIEQICQELLYSHFFTNDLNSLKNWR